MPVRELYRHDGVDYVTKHREEILTRIHLPPQNGMRATYLKLRRRESIDFPILGVAAAVKKASDGAIERARIVLTAVESAPVEAADAEEFLLGKKLTPEVVQEAAKLAYRPSKPLDNTDLTHSYRKKMARVYVARALGQLAKKGSDAFFWHPVAEINVLDPFFASSGECLGLIFRQIRIMLASQL